MELTDKVVLVTGAGGGIGASIALKFSQSGAKVVVADVIEEFSLNTVSRIMEQGGEALAVTVDVSQISSVEEMVKKILDKFGKIDILINNAGITRDNLLLRMRDEEWDKVININLKGVFNCTKAVVRPMMKQRKGKIVNIASIVGIIGNAGQSNYAASKGGVISLTKTWAKEFASRNINVNAIAPGFIRTKMTDKLSEQIREKINQQIPLKRFGEVEDVANLCVFLSSDEANYITGEVIKLDGGMAI
ncbi:3-oxoacyl-[acyl-carrier-protein] reductase [bacterium]|nr:3-oxoacyl-[acyl-carrier-protein] reductase [bacterium]